MSRAVRVPDDTNAKIAEPLSRATVQDRKDYQAGIKVLIGISTSIFKGESLEFTLKFANYLAMDWLEIKTDYLVETYDAAAALLNSKPEYLTVQGISVHSSSKGINMVGITPEQVRRHEHDLDFAKMIGADRVIFHAGYACGGSLYDELHAVIDTMRHYLDYTEGTDILILLENTMVARDKLCSDPKQLSTVLDALHHERCGATLDIVNMLGALAETDKDPDKGLKKWVRHIQLNSRPVHEGDLKIKKYLKFFLKDLELKKKLKSKHKGVYPLPAVIEGKTSLAKEMYFVNKLKQKLK